eukprot:509000-Amphidinium_carterae.1
MSSEPSSGFAIWLGKSVALPVVREREEGGFKHGETVSILVRLGCELGSAAVHHMQELIRDRSL